MAWSIWTNALEWGTWLALPGALLLGWRLKRRWRALPHRARLGRIAGIVMLAWIAEMRLETQWIVERETTLQLGFTARIAVISDVHLGPYKGAGFLGRVVDRLNGMQLDAVLIAGDLIDHPGDRLAELFKPFERLRHPAYSVPGNHDEPPAERHITPQALRRALQGVGVRPVEYTRVELQRFTLIGLGDRFAGKDSIRGLLPDAPDQRPVIALMHNPDSAMQFRPGAVSLAVAGHTHGGQIRIPRLYRRIIPSEHPFDSGLHRFGPVPVFVTSGLGEGGLPLRFLNPPVIDVLDIR